EGILIFVDPELRQLMDIKLFIDADPDVRFIRRLRRDLVERGRSVDSIVRQYEESVRPLHQQFVEPSKRHADVIIPEGGHNAVAIDLVKTKIRELLRERGVDPVPAPESGPAHHPQRSMSVGGAASTSDRSGRLCAISGTACVSS